MSEWVTITGPHAFCEGCDWTVHGDVMGARALALAARRHVEATGHVVRIERGQSRYAEPT